MSQSSTGSNFLPLKFKHSAAPHGSWWAPIWRGLVVEGTAKHYRAMRSSIWLYLYLIVHADRRSGTLFRRIDTIAHDMGVNSATVRRWMSRLARRGYISRKRTGRSLRITVERWKPLGPRAQK
jgi:helix-turn-helix protein